MPHTLEGSVECAAINTNRQRSHEKDHYSAVSLCLFALRKLETGVEIRYDYDPGGHMPGRMQCHDIVHLFDNPIQSDSVVISDEVSVEDTVQFIHSDSVVVSCEVTDQQPIQSDSVVISGEVSVEVTDQPIQPDSVVKVSAYLVLPSWKSDLSGEMSLAFSSVDRLLADRYGVVVMAALCNRGPLYFCPVISIVYRLSIFFLFLA